MSNYGVFICEHCQLDYFTGPSWEDECYCYECCADLYPEYWKQLSGKEE